MKDGTLSSYATKQSIPEVDTLTRLLVLQHCPVTPVGERAGVSRFGSILSLIRECRQAKTPILSLCFGAQLIASAFGERVWGLEVGYPAVHLTPVGWTDPLLQGLDPEQRIMQMHKHSFDLPLESVLLMRNDVCENQAFRIGASIDGIQAHPEVTRKDARNSPRDCWTAMAQHLSGP